MEGCHGGRRAGWESHPPQSVLHGNQVQNQKVMNIFPYAKRVPDFFISACRILNWAVVRNTTRV